MLSDIVDMLRCPNCASPLLIEPGAVRCERAHSFDIARQGYVNLLPGGAQAGTADSAEMVSMRERVLAAGHYRPIADAVAEATVGFGPPEGAVVEVGSGTGYYLASALEAHGGTGIALDISKHAARRAARAHPRIGSVVCDVWRALPVADGVAAAVLDVFAPRNPAEFARILRGDGVCVVVTPAPDHLTELVEKFQLLAIEEDKSAHLERKMSPWFTRVATIPVRYIINVTPEDAEAIALMGPSAFHVKSTTLRPTSKESLDVTVSVEVAVFRPV